MDYLYAYLSGFSTCAVVLGILWILRECERAKTFKKLREEIELLAAKYRRSRRSATYLYEGLSEVMNILGGRVALPAHASPKAERLEVNLQHFSQRSELRITTQLTGALVSGVPNFYGGNNEQ
jgi:hypothetical protein